MNPDVLHVSAIDDGHVCVLEYDWIRAISVCLECNHVVSDEVLFRAHRLREQRELV